jgi:N-acetylmuramoyl-L-alanine amidase
MKAVFTAIFLWIFLIAPSWAATANGVWKDIQNADTSHTPLAIHTVGTQAYIAADAILQNSCTTRFFPFRQKWKLQCASNDAYLTADNPFAIYNGQAYFIHGDVLQQGDRFSLPIPQSLPVLDSLTQKQFYWDASTNTLTSLPANDILKMDVSPRSNGTLIEFTFSKEVLVEQFIQMPFLIVNLAGVTLDTAAFRQTYTDGLVLKSSAIQEKNSAQITFTLRNKTDAKLERFTRNGGKTVQIALRPKSTEPSPKTTVAKTSSSKKVQTIVIDPGHGGKDPGALGSFAKEKDITLAVGKLLKVELEKHGFTVKMTRDSDVFVDLKTRPELATKWEGDLFVSLHANAIDAPKKRQKQVNGFKIYILREAQSEEDKALARRENQAVSMSNSGKAKDKNEISPVEWILLEHQLNLYTKESEKFTSHVVKNLTLSNLRKHGSGAGQAGFYVLVGAFMPAVLVELGFITNPKDEKYIASAKGQMEMAKFLAKAIVQYREEHE